MLYLHEATVKVRGRFPVDMLRHDSCFPSTTEDAVAIIGGRERGSLTETYHVRIAALSRNKKHWTPDRWESFGAKIVKSSVRKA